MKDTILIGDAKEQLRTLNAKSVNMIMTSPPYWALRDYNMEGQLGLESTPEEYITNLCDVFDESKRVLRDDGTCWVNLGDTYYTKSDSGFENDNLSKKTAEEVSATTGINKTNQLRGQPHPSLRSKSLVGIPFRFALEMIRRGWILRNSIIWYKPNCMPSSATDRFTVDFEYLFFFSKQQKYYFEQQREQHLWASRDMRSTKRRVESKSGKSVQEDAQYSTTATGYHPNGKNKRCVWKITTKGYSEAHFATYPEKLCETPILAGCPKGGIVLDPFFGAGTTGLVAKKQGKHYLGVELNPEYVTIANKRLKEWQGQKSMEDY